jgi:hypothetical protein
LSLLILFFRRTNLAIVPVCMPEDVAELSPRLQTLTFTHVRCVTNLSTEPLEVVVKKAPSRMNVGTSKGVQVTRRNYVVGVNL